MGLFKKILGNIGVDFTFHSFVDKIGYLTNNTLFNITTSSASVMYTGSRAGLSIWKGIKTPNTICRVLYLSSACCDTACCLSSAICAFSCYSPFAPLPALSGSFGYVCKKTADGCIAAADICDGSGLSGVEKMRYIEQALTGRRRP